MNEVSDEALQHYCGEAEATPDETLSEADRPGVGDSAVLPVRLTHAEYAELVAYAESVQVPASSLVRGWIVQRLNTQSSA